MALQQKEFSALPLRPDPGASFSEGNPWYAIAPGIWEYLLNGSAASGTKVIVQWFEPGAKTPTNDIITHDYIEEVIFIEGGLKDLTLDHREWGAGAYAYRLPGMPHGPYQATDRGCLMFVRCVPKAKDEETGTH
ncbi:hypothetical protein D9757_007990 [Collybiopsis confluens]|uniref:ChrR-like cupin domain-containing protein n=1 Tax=Collybiopsis confluens TaxID=2823264 RepID=A0A8H5H5V6_9AGAR|nr:hypothetical protein D9757_007990 [Collybiopsis confluens]